MCTGLIDALLAFLSIWLLGSVLKFPHIPWLTEAITTGIEAWFKDFSICYEGFFVGKNNSKLLSPTPGASSQKTIYCYHPHGLFSIGAVLLAVDLIRRGEKIAFVTSAHMRWFNPLLKMFMDMAGMEIVGASAKEVQAAMKRGDRSLILVPGGYEEAVLTQNGFERLFLQERKGFVKYAIRYGYSLTPVYAFGENDLYTCIPVASGLRNWLAKWKIPIVVFYGERGMPFFPHKDGKGLKIIVGNPVVFVDERSTDVRTAHALYMDRLVEMYYRHNRDADRPLEIV
jgi:2-acylglycerol O-acyltransferase 2